MARVRISMFAGLLAVGSLLGAPARADIAVSISGNGAYGNASGSWGWEFSTMSDLVVTSLGVDDITGQGLPADSTVGIWRESDQALVGSVVVPALGSLVDGFRYEAVTPLISPPRKSTGSRSGIPLETRSSGTLARMWSGPLR